MPLLTELEKRSVGWHFYKHAAPDGAFGDVGNCEISRLATAAVQAQDSGFRLSSFGFLSTLDPGT
jgi:hypothetical protein